MNKRREFSAEYKARIVIEVLKEERTLGEIASREGINPNQISNWKREFLETPAGCSPKTGLKRKQGEKYRILR